MKTELDRAFDDAAVDPQLHDCDAAYIIREQQSCLWPDGWFHLFSRSNLHAGLGFYCSDCRTSWTPAPEAGVKHCGRVEMPPPFDAITQMHRVGSGKTYPIQQPSPYSDMPFVRPPSFLTRVRDFLRV